MEIWRDDHPSVLLWLFLELYDILPTLRNPVVPPPPPFSPGIEKSLDGSQKNISLLLQLVVGFVNNDWGPCVFPLFFSSLTIISRVVRHPDSRWKLSETGEELAGRRHFMGQIRHLRGVRRSTKRLRLSPADKPDSPA